MDEESETPTATVSTEINGSTLIEPLCRWQLQQLLRLCFLRPHFGDESASYPRRHDSGVRYMRLCETSIAIVAIDAT